MLCHFDGLLAIGAMTLFMTLGWELFGAWGVLLLPVALRPLAAAVNQRGSATAGVARSTLSW